MSTLSILQYVSLTLLLPSLTAAKPILKNRLSKRDPHFNVLGGANFPDPSIINVDGLAYAFGTVDGAGHSVPYTSNPNFNNPSGWSPIRDAFPSANVPAFGSNGWAAVDTIWAPDLNRLTDYDNSFAMYYAAALKSNSEVHCLGLARSTNIAGPYNDSSSEPWICPEAQGGAIDAAGFLDSDGTRYVVYKVDGPAATGGGYCVNTMNKPSTPIILQQTKSDGYTKVGAPITLLNNNGVADRYQTEAPSILKSSDGTYFLFFSTGCYDDNSYTTSYVTSTAGVKGPYSDRQVLLKQGDFGDFGPGGADISFNGGQIVYHSLKANNSLSQGRVLNTGTITLNGRTARLN